MNGLNYHHLRYFWTVAKEGSLARAAVRLHVSPSSISEQVCALESALGEKLFRREARNNRLTETGQLVLGFAEEIFALGSEMMNAVKQPSDAKTLRLAIGVVDSFPKLVANEILKPVFSLPQPVRVVCREGKMEDLLALLTAHRLDLVLTDEPASSSMAFKSFTHPLGETGTTFCAEAKLAARLKRTFPKSLHDAPALLPSENTPFRRVLETWFRTQRLQPRVVAEFEDLALMKVMAAEGRGFIALPTVAVREARERYGFQQIGTAPKCRVQFFAITAARRIEHPGVALIAQQARKHL